jgi:hypothetical protein
MRKLHIFLFVIYVINHSIISLLKAEVMNMQPLLLALLYVCSQVTFGDVCCVAELRLSQPYILGTPFDSCDRSLYHLSL